MAKKKQQTPKDGLNDERSLEEIFGLPKLEPTEDSPPDPVNDGVPDHPPGDLPNMTVNDELQEIFLDLEALLVDERALPTERGEVIDQGWLLDSIVKVCEKRLKQIKGLVAHYDDTKFNRLAERASATGSGGSITLIGGWGSATVTVGKPAERLDTGLVKSAVGEEELRKRGWLKMDDGPTVRVSFAALG